MKRLISAAFCILISSQVFADGIVTVIRVDADGRGIVFFSPPTTQTIVGACRDTVNYNNALAFNTNTVGGKAFLAFAIAAKASGAQVASYGTGACSIYSPYKIEDFNSAYLN